MSLRINDEAPDFSAETTEGTINFHEWIGNGWAVSVLTPERLHARLHNRAWLHGRIEPRVRQTELQNYRAKRGPGEQSRKVGRGHRRDSGPQSELSR